LIKLLHAEHKEFDKHHRSSERTIQGLEGKIKGLHSCIKLLEGEIEDLKALNNEELKKLAKTEKVQAERGYCASVERGAGSGDFESGEQELLSGFDKY
jgi:FtsZ-binding cell division protein ZapB